MISISFAIESILSDPPFLKSRVTLLHRNVSARQSPTFPTIKPIKFVPSEYCDVDRKKDQKRPYQNHAPKNLQFLLERPHWLVLRLPIQRTIHHSG